MLKLLVNTWRFVNRDGGPDRRFKNNQKIPWCRYDELQLRSASGLAAAFMCSKPDGLHELGRALWLLAEGSKKLAQQRAAAKPAPAKGA
jgi:hypothetical protein